MTTTLEAPGAAAGEKLYGSPYPRIATRPLRELTPATSLGFEAVEFAEEVLGVDLLEWQKNLLIASLELAEGSYTWDPEPRLRFKTVLILVARQNGKSFIASVRMLWRMFMWDNPHPTPTLVIGAAHKLGAAQEIWGLANEMVKQSPEMRPFIDKKNGGHIRSTNGDYETKFGEVGGEDLGSRWRCEAANDDGGRSYSADDLLFDELRQQRTWDPWTALKNTTNARFSSQVIAVSNAGEAKSVVLKDLRAAAIKQVDNPATQTAIFEWSAREGRSVWDRAGWAEANPSLGYLGDIESTLEDILESGVPEHKFRTENLCQWVTLATEGPFDPEKVAACLDDESEIAPDSPVTLAYDLSIDRKTGWLAVAGWRADGLPHVEVVARRAGSEWVVPTITEGLNFEPADVVVQQRGAPASSVVEHLVRAGVTPTPWPTTALGSSCGQLADRIESGKLRFRAQPALTVALAEAVKHQNGEVWFWDRGRSPVDVAPLCAVTFALWALERLEKTEAITAYDETYEGWWRE